MKCSLIIGSVIMKVKFAVVIVVLIALTGAGAVFFFRGGDGGGVLIEPGRVFKVGIECDFVPYNWQEAAPSDTNVPLANNEGFYAEGYDVQIAKAIADKMGVKIEIHKVAWGDILPFLKDGKIDIIISGMVDTKERREIADFSDVYTAQPIEYCIMVREDDRFAEAGMLADFYGARMVGQKESKMDELIDQVPGVVHLPPVDTIPQMFEALHRGEADGVIITRESTSSMMKEFPGLAVVRFVYGQGFKLDYNGICAAVRKGDKQLLKAINNALSGISTETRMELINRMTEKSEKANKAG